LVNYYYSQLTRQLVALLSGSRCPAFTLKFFVPLIELDLLFSGYRNRVVLLTVQTILPEPALAITLMGRIFVRDFLNAASYVFGRTL
jgi:hypothetical protein